MRGAEAGCLDLCQATPPSPRWAAAAALQDGMERIHIELEELRHYEVGRTDTAMAAPAEHAR